MTDRIRARSLMGALLLLLAGPFPALAQEATSADVARWERQARDVTILRDRWGIAHVYGRTDADAVFGMEYAQAEDDFARIEANYLFSLGRTAEAEGEEALWQDLRARMYADPDSLQAMYARSPASLKALMDAFADGLNYFLHTHPEVEPRAIHRFEPWMALSFTEGSIGGDIERISLDDLADFYGPGGPVAGDGDGDFASAPRATWPIDAPSLPARRAGDPAPEPRGSNGVAIAPKNTLNGNALLFINPHTSFYFRSELQMVSDEGLNAYGAVTWGQFFIYQGFNETAGWMHTSSGVDNIDWFRETPVRRGNGWAYRYDGSDRPVASRDVTLKYRTASGGLAERTFTYYRTHRGPVVARDGNRWLSVSLMWQPIDALTQSYTRTKSPDLADYLRVMELHTNSSNNTLFADASGNVAYLHSNYIPRRNDSFDWNEPVDGSDPATAYDGVLSLEETPNAINPGVGWVYNSNNWPWSAAGPDSPARGTFPTYVERGRHESPRGRHALELLPDRHDFTMASLTALAYDSHLPSFDMMLPPLLTAFDHLPAADPMRARLEGPITLLRAWDHRWGVNSVATSLAVFWGEDVLRRVGSGSRAADMPGEDFIGEGRAEAADLLASLAAALDRLEDDFGSWQTPWGQINRFQRISPDIRPMFDDARHSTPVPFTSARWGSLASFGARPYPNTNRWYGTSGNSFVAAVEFGDRVRARALTAGGESGHPDSPHFDDQIALYAMGSLRDVLFYREDVEANLEERYRPGERGGR